jgi:galactitol-specific phosphotransferase system IIC component
MWSCINDQKLYSIESGEPVMKCSFTLLFALVAVSAMAADLPAAGSYDDYLLDSMKDKNVGIRTSAAILLGERRVMAAKEPLVRMLTRDKAYQARIIAGLALLKLGDVEALSIVQKCAKSDKNQTVRHVLAGVAVELKKEYLVKGKTSPKTVL